jgi:hypothetical protein
VRFATLAVTAASALLAAAPSSALAPSVPSCAFGDDVPGLGGYYAGALTSAQRGYAAQLTGLSDAERQRSLEAFTAAAIAYVYGLPQVSVRAAVKRYPRGVLLSVAKLADPGVRAVVAPNNDTAYTVSFIDLASGPEVIDVPDAAGRYYVLALMDAFSNDFAYIGRRATGTGAGSFALVPPGWSGTLPAGVRRIDAPSNTVWLLGRTVINGATDVPAVKALLQRFHLTPLGAWEAGVKAPPVVLDDFPPGQGSTPTPTGSNFIATLNRDMQIDPPPTVDACAVQAMAAAGVQAPPGDAATELAADVADATGPPASSGADPALTAGTAAGAQIVAHAAAALNAAHRTAENGWEVESGPWVGRFGRAYLGRAIIAHILLAANVPEEAIYPVATADARGRTLDGAHRYTIRFAAGELPPVDAFWSLTLYDQDLFLYENQIHRYSIGDRTPGLRPGPDGSLTLYVQHDPPADPAARQNWLPAPAGRFEVYMRLYQPRAVALSGAWKPPPILRDDDAAPSAAAVRQAPYIELRGIPRGCVHSALRLRVRARLGGPARLVTVRLDGRRVARVRHSRFAVTLRLRHRGRHRIDVIARGDSQTVTRRVVVSRC